MSCSDPGATHHTGCACNEERWKAEVERLRDIVAVNDQRLADVWDQSRAEVKRAFDDGARAMKFEMIRIAMRVTSDGQAWPELMVRLKEATVHEGEAE